jgi:peptidyl-prolyl cis-trans isomerase SurA
MITSLLATLLLAATASNAEDKAWSQQNTDRIVVVAGDEVVTVSDIRKQLAPFARTLEGTADQKDEAIRKAADDVMRSLSDRAIVLREFRESSKMTIPPAMIESDIDDTVRRQFGGDRLRYYAALREVGLSLAENRKQIEDRIIFEYMIGEVRKGIAEVSPARIQAYYDAHKADYKRPEQVRFRQIAILRRASESPEETLKRAQAVQAAIRSGTGDMRERFASAAKVSSDDENRSAGGDTGWRDVTALAEIAVQEIRKLPEGGISDLVTLDAGGEKAHFLFLRERFRSAGTAPIEDVRTVIETTLREEMGSKAVNAWLERLREKHSPEIR